jgi:hypothetical protein
MGRQAERIYTQPGDISRIQRFVVALPSQARVRITMQNGDIIAGTVTERPAAQLFEDASGATGMNAQVRLDDPTAPAWKAYLLLGDIEHVERMMES